MVLMPGADLRRERAIYAQKNKDVSFASDKKKRNILQVYTHTHMHTVTGCGAVEREARRRRARSLYCGFVHNPSVTIIDALSDF